MNFFYFAFRITTYPFGFLPQSWIHGFGKHLGSLAYYLIPKYRKRCLSNLALATTLFLSNDEIKKVAKLSLQNTMIGILEYPKLKQLTNINKIARIDNLKAMQDVMQLGKGCIIFCGHQANFEVTFLTLTSFFPGVAVGRPIKNKRAYNFILTIREKFGGKIIEPKNAVREGVRAIKSGAFLGVVGDQAMIHSDYASLFFGRNAWSSTICALLAYRTQVPIFVTTARREKGQYCIKIGDPIYPDLSRPMREDIDRMMKKTLSTFEESVRQRPGEWLWQHNRWKQKTNVRLKKQFRYDCIAVILPPNDTENFFAEVIALRKKYPYDFFTLFIPVEYKNFFLPDVELIFYKTLADILIDDYRFKIIFDLSSNSKIKKHFLKLSAMKVVSLLELRAFLSF